MRYASILILAVFSVLIAAENAAPDDRALPGRSRHGEAFDRGPRQSAYLMGGTGKVDFPVTTNNPLVQKFINQGVGQLHGFWFYEAERSFRKAAELDPNCGIAYWGMAWANPKNESRAKQFVIEARKHATGLTERERMYIDALSHDRGLMPIVEKYPQDLEAKAFHVWSMWRKYEYTLPVHPELIEGLDLADAILKGEPLHPINHAVIHIADLMNHEIQALDSAARCGDSAPSIGHMWHMPTHIYFALKQYPEAAWQLEASIRVEHARMMHDRVLPDQVHLYAHNNEWLVRTLLYLGRVNDARRVAIHMIDLPRHPQLNVIEPPEGGPQDEHSLVENHGSSAYYGRERLLMTLRQYEYWDELIEMCRTGYIERTGLPGEQGKVLVNLGVAHYCRGDRAEGDRQFTALRRLFDEQNAARNSAFAEALGKPEHQRLGAVGAVEKRFKDPLSELSEGAKELESYRRLAEDFFVSRRLLLILLSLIGVFEVVVFWLLRRRLVRAAFTLVPALVAVVWLFRSHVALWNLPYDSTNVDFAYMARMQLAAGDPDVAEWTAQQFAINRPKQARPQANLVEILYRIGKKEEARAEFDALRFVAGTADIDAPPFQRLAPIAQEFGFPTDWRLPDRIRAALAARRPLESLGPLLWRPWPAPDWKLKDGHGKEHSLGELKGKPVVMLFFLGAGCLHCAQQLETFAKKAQEFSDAGLTVVAVSTDDEAGVKKSLDNYRPGPFPYLILSDANSQVFKSFRAYDDFEKIALHGTFVLDAEGLVRWHDVSFEPFMDAAFVLRESQRLLAKQVAPVDPGARVIADVDGTAGLSAPSIPR